MKHRWVIRIIASILLIALLGVPLSAMITQAQSGFDWNTDEIEEILQYMDDHLLYFDEQNKEFIWDFSNPNDIEMANKFIQSVLNVERIRDENDDATITTLVSRALSLNDWNGDPTVINTPLKAFDHIVVNFLTNEEFLRNSMSGLFDWLVNNGYVDSVQDAALLKTEVVNWMTNTGWFYHNQLQQPSFDFENFEFDTSYADTATYPTLAKYAGVFRIAITAAKLVNSVAKHILIMYDIYNSDDDDIMEIVKKNEVGVQLLRGGIDLGTTIAGMLAGTAAAKAGATAITLATAPVAGPFAIVIGIASYAAISYAIENTVEALVYLAVSEIDILDQPCWERLKDHGIDVSKLLWAIQIKDIHDIGDDNYIPWETGSEKVWIEVENVGVRTLSVRAEPMHEPSGWIVDAPGVLHNWVQVDGLEPTSSTGVDGLWFEVESGYNDWWNWPPGERKPGLNPVELRFTLEHDVQTAWWNFGDFGESNKPLGTTHELFRNVPISQRSHIDVTLIIDDSGSMSSNDPSYMRRQAAMLFIDAMQNDDRVGIVEFDGSANTPWPIQTLGADRTQIKNSLNSLSPYDGTSLSAGLSAGYQQLLTVESSGNDKAAVFLTDGVGYYSNEAQLYAAKDWPIYVLGLGSSIDEPLLQQIADDSGGEYQHLDDASQMQSVYNKIATAISGGSMILDESTHLDLGATLQFETALTTDAAYGNFFVGWGGSTVDLSLTTPDGTFIGPNITDPNVYHSKSSTYELYRISNLIPGNWTLVVFGSGLPVGGEDIVVQVSVIPNIPTQVNNSPVADAGPDQTVCVIPPATTAMVTLDGSGSYDPDGDPLTYNWTWDGHVAHGVNPTLELPLGTTELNLSVSDGKASDTDTVNITISQGPTAAFSANVTGCCEPLTVQFNDNSTAGDNPITNWYWDFGDGDTSTYQNPSHIYNDDGTYTVTFNVTDSHGCSDMEIKTGYITVNPKPMATASSNSPVTQGATIQLIGGPGGIASYSWTGPNSFTSNSWDPTIPDAATAMAGNYILTVTNEHGCTSDPATTNVVVRVPPLPPTPSPSPPTAAAGGCPLTKYLTVDWDENITQGPLYNNDRLSVDLLGPSPDDSHSLFLERGTHTPTVDGRTYYEIVIRELEEIPPLPENTEAIVAFEITPSGAVFDRDIFLTLGLDQSQLPEDALNVTMAYYDDVGGGWVPLESEAGEPSGVAELTISAAVNHFSIFGVLVELEPTPAPPPAHFEANGLNIEPSVEKIWEPVTFVTKTGESVTITANVANDGGQKGPYTVELKLNGETVDTKTVTLGAGQSQEVSFTVSGLDYGQYQVEVAGLTDEFTTSRTITWWLIIVLIVALGVIIWGVVWGRKRTRRASQEG